MRRHDPSPRDPSARLRLAHWATGLVAATATVSSGTLAVPVAARGGPAAGPLPVPPPPTAAVESTAASPFPAGTDDAVRRHDPPDTTDTGDVRTLTLEGDRITFPAPEEPDRPLMVLDPRLAERIGGMALRSPKWAEALAALRRERFPVLVGSITQVEEVLPGLRRYRFDGAGAAWLFADGRGRPVAAAVTLNLPKLVIRNRITGGETGHLRRMLELHLAHELYGHVLPVATSRDLGHPCADDPDPHAPPRVQRRSCVMEREAEILRDLGYVPRASYQWHFWDERIERLDPEESDRRGGGGPGAGR